MIINAQLQGRWVCGFAELRMHGGGALLLLSPTLSSLGSAAHLVFPYLTETISNATAATLNTASVAMCAAAVCQDRLVPSAAESHTSAEGSTPPTSSTVPARGHIAKFCAI